MVRMRKTSKRNESKLVARAVKGNADAFGDLYELHISAIYRYILYRVGDPQEAREFIQRARLALESGDGQEPAATASPGTAEALDVNLKVFRDRLCDVLINYLGPVAPLICEEQFAAVGKEVTRERLERMITNIAAEIGDEDETAEFVTEARQQLAALGD